MGQIVGTSAKVKRCNLTAIQSGGSLYSTVLASGEYMLVSTENSMDSNGNGLFDCYVIGDGTTDCANLEIHILDDIKIIDIGNVDDLDIADENGNVLVRFAGGEVQTKNFDSQLTPQIIEDNSTSDLEISDKDGNVLVRFNDGGIKTKNFDSNDTITSQTIYTF